MTRRAIKVIIKHETTYAPTHKTEAHTFRVTLLYFHDVERDVNLALTKGEDIRAKNSQNYSLITSHSSNILKMVKLRVLDFWHASESSEMHKKYYVQESRLTQPRGRLMLRL